jgi:hypothetical protein
LSHSLRHFGRFLPIAALLLSGGAHWLLLQSVAWTGMLVTRASHGSLIEAVKLTFDGAHPCVLCEKIEAGRKGEKQQENSALPLKIELFYQPASVTLSPPAPQSWDVIPLLVAQIRKQPPAIPPPRLG